MSKTTLRYSIAGGFVLVIVTVFAVRHSSQETVVEVESQDPGQVVTVSPPALVSEEVAKAPTVEAPVKTAVVEKSLTDSEKKELSAQLEDFDRLYNKLLKNEDERDSYQASLKNPNVFRLLKRAVLHPSRENAKLQDLSVTYLMEALQAHSEEASRVVNDIIADNTIENPTVDSQSRQLQAELKADILYQWTSMHPEQVQHVSSILPGRASQRIWQNVLDLQASNEAESLQAQ